MLTPDWLQEGISAVAERDGFIAVADTGGRVTFFSEDLQVNDGQIYLSMSNIFTCSDLSGCRTSAWAASCRSPSTWSTTPSSSRLSVIGGDLVTVSCDWWRAGHVTSA